MTEAPNSSLFFFKKAFEAHMCLVPVGYLAVSRLRMGRYICGKLLSVAFEHKWTFDAFFTAYS